MSINEDRSDEALSLAGSADTAPTALGMTMVASAVRKVEVIEPAAGQRALSGASDRQAVVGKWARNHQSANARLSKRPPRIRLCRSASGAPSRGSAEGATGVGHCSVIPPWFTSKSITSTCAGANVTVASR